MLSPEAAVTMSLLRVELVSSISLKIEFGCRNEQTANVES